MTNRVSRNSDHGSDFQRLIGSDLTSFRLRHLTLPDGEVGRELLSVALIDRTGEVVEVRPSADGIRLVLAPNAWGPQDMAGLGQITEHPLCRQDNIISFRHILGRRSTELILGLPGQPTLRACRV